MPTALVRSVGDSFAQALSVPEERGVDVALARSQHDRYRAELVGAGYIVEVVAADETCPDGVFIEDTAVVIGDTAVITRPGAPSRRPEVGSVAKALARHLDEIEIEAPGTLDGGDVFRAGNTIYAGLSKRTNRAGVDQLSRVASDAGLEVATVAVLDTLHLKSAVLPLDQETVVVTRGGADEKRLDPLRIVYEDPRERYRCSVLPMDDGRVLVTASAPRTAELIAGLGYHVVPIDISEFQAKSGGLTCLSILF